MITEDYVSFYSAKLLKEKGFNEYCTAYYFNKTLVKRTPVCNNSNAPIESIVAPTLQMAMKWLRENKGLFIKIDVISEASCWLSEVLDIHGCNKQWVVPKENQNYEEAVENSIKYCLENLI